MDGGCFLRKKHYLRPCCGINEQKAEMAEWGEVAAAAAGGVVLYEEKGGFGKFLG